MGISLSALLLHTQQKDCTGNSLQSRLTQISIVDEICFLNVATIRITGPFSWYFIFFSFTFFSCITCFDYQFIMDRNQTWHRTRVILLLFLRTLQDFTESTPDLTADSCAVRREALRSESQDRRFQPNIGGNILYAKNTHLIFHNKPSQSGMPEIDI